MKMRTKKRKRKRKAWAHTFYKEIAQKLKFLKNLRMTFRNRQYLVDDGIRVRGWVDLARRFTHLLPRSNRVQETYLDLGNVYRDLLLCSTYEGVGHQVFRVSSYNWSVYESAWKFWLDLLAIDEKEAEGTMDFPAVTICNVNAIRISKLTKDDVFHVGQFFGLIQSDGVRRKLNLNFELIDISTKLLSFSDF